MKEKKTILIIINNHNSFKIIDFVETLKSSEPDLDYAFICQSSFVQKIKERLPNSKKKVFVLDNDFKLSRFLKEKIRIVQETGSHGNDVENLSSTVSWKSKLKTRLKLFVNELSVVLFIKEQLIYKRIQFFKKKVDKYFVEYNFFAVFSISDRTHDYVECATLWCAKKRGVKVVLPYIAFFDMDSALEMRKDINGKTFRELNAKKPFNFYFWISRIILKNQRIENCFYQKPFILNACRRAETLSSNPWCIGNGNSDIVCVNNAYSKLIYIQNKTPPQKILLTGDVSIKDIYSSYVDSAIIKNKIVNRYKLDPSKKILILSLPQLAEQGYIDWDTHWADTHFIVSTTLSRNVNVLFSLHPRQKREDYSFIEDKYNGKILYESLSEVVGIADYFLCTSSSTIVWAILCGASVLNFDFNLKLKTFDFLTSAEYANTYDLFEKKLDKLLKGDHKPLDEDWNLLSRDFLFRNNFITDVSDSLLQKLER